MVNLSLREARSTEAIRIATLLRTSLQRGVEGRFTIDSKRLYDHVMQTITSINGFALVLENGEGLIVGCFMAEIQQHAYCAGYIAKELGVFIDDNHRGGRSFEKMFLKYIEWAESKPDVLLKTFNIGQLGRTTPYLRAVLKRHGFVQGDEGYFKS